MRRTPFTEGEWFHCYSRGIDKRITFEAPADYQRYLQLLYLCNSDVPIHRSDLFRLSPEAIYAHPRGNQLVIVGAFSLMPNHTHLLVKELMSGGISNFVGRVHNAYTKFFNIKNDRVGNLFVHPFRAKHVPEDRYFTHVTRYILLNPAELFEPGWKRGQVRNLKLLEKKLMLYPHASISDYWGAARSETTILDQAAIEFIREKLPPFAELLEDTVLYYRENSEKKRWGKRVNVGG